MAKSKKYRYTQDQKEAFVTYLFKMCNEVGHAAVRMLRPDLSIIESYEQAEVLFQDKYVQKLMDEYLHEHKNDPVKVERQVVNELLNVALVDITDFYEDQGTGLKLRQLRDLTRNQTAAIKKINIKNTRNGQEISIEMLDKMKAFEVLGRYYKFLMPDADESDNMDFIKMSALLADHLEHVETVISSEDGPVKQKESRKIKT